MPRLFPVLLVLLLAPLATLRAADPAAELASFSVFPTVDPALLLKEVRTARGPATSVNRHLSVQSCYVVPGAPAKALEAIRSWDPTRHRELGIALHMELPASAAPADFARLASAGDSLAKSISAATQKLAPTLQISRDEAKKFGSAKESPLKDFWPPLLAARAGAFAAGGAARQPAYDFTGQDVKPGDELAALLKNQPKIRGQFSAFLNDSGALGGKASLKQEHYCELIKVEDDGVLTLGAFGSKAAGSGFQAADLLYYASGGYYVALTLYQLWPIEAGGQPATLVWRGDMISSASLASLHGIEKMGSESAMMKNISRAVNLLRRDTSEH